jgi:hypothetical protein
MKPLELTYDDLSTNSTAEMLMVHSEINCVISLKKAKVLQTNWAKYHRYWNSKERSPRSIFTAILGVVWILHRAITDIKFPNLSTLIEAYTINGYMMEPVQFEKIDGESAVLRTKR